MAERAAGADGPVGDRQRHRRPARCGDLHRHGRRSAARRSSTTTCQRVLRAVNDRGVRAERSIIHALPIGYALDGQTGIRDPRGMVGERARRRRRGGLAPKRSPCAISNWCSIAATCRSRRWWRRPMPAVSRRWSTMRPNWASPVIDFGGATTTVAVFNEGAAGLCRRARHRRPPPHARHRPAAVGRASPMPSG